MNGTDGEYNVKFISADGHFEAVYDKEGKLLTEENDPINMGTYNYFGPNDFNGHKEYDVEPYYIYGNTVNQKGRGELNELKSAAVNLINFEINKEAQKQYFETLKRSNPNIYYNTIKIGENISQRALSL